MNIDLVLSLLSLYLSLTRWVAYEEPGFSGEQYVLEKGLYGSPEDWAAIHPKISSVMPVMRVNINSAI